MPFSDLLAPHQEHTLDHQRLRARMGGKSLRRAVRLAVQKLFAFSHRSLSGEALWSRREHVWLGRVTFLHWALNDAAIDIPWVVTNASRAPSRGEDLQTAVREELIALWDQRLATLPRKRTPAWLPLP